MSDNQLKSLKLAQKADAIQRRAKMDACIKAAAVWYAKKEEPVLAD